MKKSDLPYVLALGGLATGIGAMLLWPSIQKLLLTPSLTATVSEAGFWRPGSTERTDVNTRI